MTEFAAVLDADYPRSMGLICDLAIQHGFCVNKSYLIFSYLKFIECGLEAEFIQILAQSTGRFCGIILINIHRCIVHGGLSVNIQMACRRMVSIDL